MHSKALVFLGLIALPNLAFGDPLKDSIFDLGDRIQREIYPSHSSRDQLERARQNLAEALNLIIGGGGGPVTYRFRCEAVDPLYSRLETHLKIIVTGSGSTFSRVADTLNYRDECNAVVARLHAGGDSGSCAIKYCQAVDTLYNSLETNLIELRISPDGETDVSAVDSFSYRRDCLPYEG